MKFVCDYCKLEITSSPIYTETKVFAGRKINELLQIVTNFSLPSNFRIELCNVCASNLIIATSLIEKMQKLIDNSLEKTETYDQNENEEVDLNHDLQLVDMKQNASPSYLTDAVQLLPSNNKPKKNQSLVQLFGVSGASNVKASLSLEDHTLERETKEVTEIVNPDVEDFGCRLCDFMSMDAQSLKQHLKSVHQLQRPRVFFCNVCPKSFGLLKTHSKHLLTHGITNQQDTTKSQEKMTKKNPTASKHMALVKEPKSREVSTSSVPVVIQKMVDHTINPNCNFKDIGENKIENIMEYIDNGAKPIKQSNKIEILGVEIIKKPNLIQSIENNLSSKPTIFNSLKEQTERESKTPNHSLALSMAIESSPTKVFNPENTIDFNDAETFSSSSIEISSTKCIENPVDDESTAKQILHLDNESKHKIVKRKLCNPLYYDDKSKNIPITEDVKKIDESFDGINDEVMPLKKAKPASSETDDNVVNCSQCGKTVSSLKSLQSHMEKKHNQILKCPICLSVYACHLKYVTHFSKCDKLYGVPCGVRKCKKIFENCDFLILHLKNKHKFF